MNVAVVNCALLVVTEVIAAGPAGIPGPPKALAHGPPAPGHVPRGPDFLRQRILLPFSCLIICETQCTTLYAIGFVLGNVCQEGGEKFVECPDAW